MSKTLAAVPAVATFIFSLGDRSRLLDKDPFSRPLLFRVLEIGIQWLPISAWRIVRPAIEESNRARHRRVSRS
ncbi:hypothetical protein [Roseimaritima multifibrata]|uniref:hypothetical protein n=1 Tax=Roseimaritima multifibrata TaxID=1930274 RepID=UPI0011A6DD1D|nr:hypothetical protein [Roseimaritima multifibrata]